MQLIHFVDLIYSGDLKKNNTNSLSHKGGKANVNVLSPLII